jgi:hypothetical protein
MLVDAEMCLGEVCWLVESVAEGENRLVEVERWLEEIC